MEFDELKKEADALGYRLVKKTEYTKHLKCNCGGTGSVWYSTSGKGKVVKCRKCNKEAEYCATETLAWQSWNKMQSKEVKYDEN